MVATLLILLGIALLHDHACHAEPAASALPDKSQAVSPAQRKPASRAMLKMPGKSFQGPLPQLDAAEIQLRDQLRVDVKELAGKIGERHVYRYPQLVAAAAAIDKSLTAVGYKVARQTFEVRGRKCDNLEVEIAGQEKPQEIVIVGAHYDSAQQATGANDNGSGVASLLAIARHLAGKKPARTVRLVAFVNEEPPFFQTESMGSLVYARRCKARKENIVGMLSLETIGYFSDEPKSQHYPAPLSLFYPSTGNFIAFVGNEASADFVVQTVTAFRTLAKFPSEGAALSERFEGVGWSDHWSFWQHGFPALMVTDTAPFRYPHYHTPQDTPDKIDYDRMARVVAGLQRVIDELAGVKER